MRPKAFLIKIRSDDWVDVIEIPRWMMDRERASFNRDCKTKYKDYTFTLATDIEEAIDKAMNPHAMPV